MVFTPEERKVYNKKYYQENKEKMKEFNKEYRNNNKEKIKENRNNNKEYYKEYRKQYSKTPKGKKCIIINSWKRFGLICDDYDSLYCHYINASECDNCNITFGEKGDGTGTFKCLDHSHETGEFRNFLCSKCNILRG